MKAPPDRPAPSRAGVRRTGARIVGLAIVAKRRCLAALHAINVLRLHRYARARSWRLRRRSGDGRWQRYFSTGIYLSLVLEYVRRALLRQNTRGYVIQQRHATAQGARPRILHAIPNVFIGGSTQLIVDLHDHLGHLYDMHVVTAALPPAGAHAGMTIHHLPTNTPAAEFTRLMRRLEPDLVHVHYWGDIDTPWYESLFQSIGECRLRSIENINTPVAPMIDRSVQAYVFVSDYVRDSFGRGMRDAVTIHPGIDLARFGKRDSWSAEASDSVGMVYRLHTDKLDRDAIDPLLLLARMRPRTRVYVIGDGILFDVFRKRVLAEGLADNFVFTGEVSHTRLQEYYGNFRVFVAPVARESFGQVVPIAMALGQLVAGYDVGALPEILESRSTVASSAAELAAILVGLLDDRDHWDAMSALNARRAQRFSVEAMAAAYRATYARLLDGRSTAGPALPEAS